MSVFFISSNLLTCRMDSPLKVCPYVCSKFSMESCLLFLLLFKHLLFPASVCLRLHYSLFSAECPIFTLQSRETHKEGILNNNGSSSEELSYKLHVNFNIFLHKNLWNNAICFVLSKHKAHSRTSCKQEVRRSPE